MNKINAKINRYIFNFFAMLLLIVLLNVGKGCFAAKSFKNEEDDVYINEKLDELEHKFGKTTKELFGLEQGEIKGVALYSLAKDKGMMGGNYYFEVRTKDGKAQVYSMGIGVRNPVSRPVESTSVTGLNKEGLDKRRGILDKKLDTKGVTKEIVISKKDSSLKSQDNCSKDPRSNCISKKVIQETMDN